jgi:AraC family transcriptional regulator of adaptative response / DNA-3-methyladenine glycosylase II
MTEIADAAGFSSIQRFNDAMRTHLGASPRDLRRAAPAMRPERVGVGVGLRAAGKDAPMVR